MRVVQLGPVVRRVCPKCELALAGDGVERTCARCGAGLVEIRGEHDPMIGQLVDGRFEIRAKLGQGGMGTVYRAWQASVEREVAIKLLDHAFSSDPMAVRRFEREARLASRLSQPNTVSVFDFGKAGDGRLFIAMELIRGRTLRDVLVADGVFSVERAVRVAVQICDALEAAHTLGIVHRDLKLDNVLVLDDPPGRDLVKVLDFGLAKLVDDPRGTAAGIVVGTPRYMAPETATTGTALPAGDLYAVGVIVGELATGKPLWEGDRLAELLAHKLAPAAALAAVPSRLRGVVGALLDPAPERRPSAAHIRAKLLAVAEPPPRTPTMRSRRPTHWKLIALASASVAIAAVVTAYILVGDQLPAPAQPPPPQSIAATPPTPADASPPPDAPPAPPAPDAAAPALGYPGDDVVIHVRSRPSDVAISVDGKRVGRTPIDLTTGHSTSPLEIEGRLGSIVRHELVQPDRERDVELDFRRLDCTRDLQDPRNVECQVQYCRAHPDEARCGATDY